MKLALSLHEITRRGPIPDRRQGLCPGRDAKKRHAVFRRRSASAQRPIRSMYRQRACGIRCTWNSTASPLMRCGGRRSGIRPFASETCLSRHPCTSGLQEQLRAPLAPRFSERPVSVRSSAPGEDSSRTSFAGLHESFVNIRGLESILEHIRLVWASLWSDRALLYRQELGLDVEKSAMAVVVQEMVLGERSGVVFGMSPVHEGQSAIEAVYGLNQGLVDGTVEPDRWILDRDSGRILSHHAARREKILVPVTTGCPIGEPPGQTSASCSSQEQGSQRSLWSCHEGRDPVRLPPGCGVDL